MGGNSISQSLQWTGIILVYFFVMTIILTSVQVSVNSIGYSDTSYNLTSYNSKCSEPRTLYTENNEYVSEGTNAAYIRNYLDCESSVGTRANSTCQSINGCSWSKPTAEWFGLVQKNYTCIGTINYTYYNLETETTWQGKIVSNSSHYYSVCVQPSVLNVKNTCELLGCTWLTPQDLKTMDIKEAQISTEWFGVAFSTLGELITVSYDFGFDDYSNGILSFIIFYIPIIILAFALYGLVPFI
jgi:hypothetical protein